MNSQKKPKLRNWAKYFIIIATLITFYWGSDIFYVWLNTESTDNAYVEADISLVSPEVSGVVSEILVQENSKVEKGQIVARIKKDDFDSDYEKANALTRQAEEEIEVIEQNIKLAEINQLKSKEALEFAQTNHKLTSVNYDRVSKLSQDNFASKKVKDDTEIALEKAKTELSQAELNIKTNEEQLALLESQKQAAIARLKVAIESREIAERALKNTDITSPISGILGNSGLKVGNYVRTGVSLFSVIPIDELYIKANFKETQITHFSPNMKAELVFDAAKDITIPGTIRNIAPATGSKFSLIPPQNATGNFTKIVQRVPVTIDFKIPEELKNKLVIVPGMSVVVRVRIDQ